MQSETMREEFEAWAVGYCPGIDIEEEREGDGYRYYTGQWWDAWQASRESLVIDWPDQHTYTAPDCAGAAILDCRTAYSNALGLKVKP